MTEIPCQSDIKTSGNNQEDPDAKWVGRKPVTSCSVIILLYSFLGKGSWAAHPNAHTPFSCCGGYSMRPGQCAQWCHLL